MEVADEEVARFRGHHRVAGSLQPNRVANRVVQPQDELNVPDTGSASAESFYFSALSFIVNPLR